MPYRDQAPNRDPARTSQIPQPPTRQIPRPPADPTGRPVSHDDRRPSQDPSRSSSTARAWSELDRPATRMM
ncbi:MAG: hypothetical protein M3Y77_11435, partial [Actinomycetota bacterium]|nr:hypothetical protein [Actinomycetota bacterium]